MSKFRERSRTQTRLSFYIRRIMKFDYESRKWKSKQRAIMRRDGYMCQACKRYGRKREARVVHHIKHVDTFPELAYTDSNLISLCIECHNREHPEKGKAAAMARY